MVMIPLIYKGQERSKTYVIVILVEDEIIIELKAQDGILPVHETQLIGYLNRRTRSRAFLKFQCPIIERTDLGDL